MNGQRPKDATTTTTKGWERARMNMIVIIIVKPIISFRIILAQVCFLAFCCSLKNPTPAHPGWPIGRTWVFDPIVHSYVYYSLRLFWCGLTSPPRCLQHASLAPEGRGEATASTCWPWLQRAEARRATIGSRCHNYLIFFATKTLPRQL